MRLSVPFNRRRMFSRWVKTMNNHTITAVQSTEFHCGYSGRTETAKAATPRIEPSDT